MVCNHGVRGSSPLRSTNAFSNLAGTAFGRKPFCDVLCDLLRDVAGDAHYGHVARLAFGKLSDDGVAQTADAPAPASSSFSLHSAPPSLCVSRPRCPHPNLKLNH